MLKFGLFSSNTDLNSNIFRTFTESDKKIEFSIERLIKCLINLLEFDEFYNNEIKKLDQKRCTIIN